MVAYLEKTRDGFNLKLCLKPCNGSEYTNSETIKVAGKREARAIAQARSAKPWNF